MSDKRTLTWVIAGLGLTQIVGYGTLYYSFSVLAPAVAPALGWSTEGLYAALTVALLAGGLLGPVAGKWADRYGAGRIMAVGSLVAAAALAAAGLAPGGAGYAVALVIGELASALVLYSTAFAAIVQVGGDQRTITYLTLIAGFASTIFWPLTDALQHGVGWRGTYLAFAIMNIALCLPVHAGIAGLKRHDVHREATEGAFPTKSTRLGGPKFVLMLAGFLTEGFVLSAVLFHLVPVLQDLGLGGSGVLVTTLFGPAQVLSRLTNMVFGRELPQTILAVLAACALPLGVAILLPTAPSIWGACVFAVIFGLGSGLTSIIGGTLPLELFGREGYGARLGWIGAARTFASALAPYALALLLGRTGTVTGLWIVAASALVGIAAFSALAVAATRPQLRPV
ncbi:MAG: MFS transporter [Devosia sp. 67-54]|uniref:arsenite efflux MFS transporter ArsK n=1 Tax=unclassified Devosia TaxID=196773 RepID=UPI00095C447A|nr:MULTISPECIES: arsenite efflux MFS transporter ArsK [unclassified Devosia]MBN9307510.1 arsenite efflux MFS transporter ArsK [Devosia sp.]OJX19887.1 MAG: MFS transporter [Devosia sp. 67-54]